MVGSKFWPREASLHDQHRFQDISTVLTPVSTHEQSLEMEFNNICNDIGSNPFRWSNQN